MSSDHGELGSALTFRVLGDLEVTVNDRVVPLGGPQQRLVLALLIASAPDPVPIERLEADLWGEEAPRTARRTVQVYVSNLRRAIGVNDVILTTRGGYKIDLDKAELDAVVARSKIDQARSRLAETPGEAVKLAEDGLEMWRGQAYEDHRDIDRLRPEIQRLEELRNLGQETWLSARLANGETDSLIPDLEAFCGVHPLREKAQGLLMTALHAVGRTSEALAVYRRVQQALAVELGIEPSTELRLIEARIVEDDSARSAPTSGPRAPSDHGVPRYLTSFIGRRSEIDEVRQRLERFRMVTLLGPGGIGKTRLAVACVADDHELDVTFVALAGVGGDGDVISEIAAALAVEPMSGIPETEAVVEALSEGAKVLVLDNCEHVAATASAAAELLLARCPALRVLTTSRIALGGDAEVTYPVPPLSLQAPEGRAESDAMRLFTDRWSARSPLLELTEENVSAVAAICVRLDGVPLALELAASRTDVLSPQQIESRLGDSPALLSDRRRRGRHTTLQSTIEWSLSLLDDAEMLLLLRLSVFRGRFDIDAAEYVCAYDELGDTDLIDLIGSLADQSMLQVTSSGEGPMGYRLLVPVRETLETKLDGAQTHRLRDRHLDYFRTLISNHRETRRRSLGKDIRDDVGHALTHAFDSRRLEVAAEMVSNLQTWWSVVGLREDGLAWSQRLLEDVGDLPPEVAAEVMHVRAGALFHVQRLEECLDLMVRLVTVRSQLGDPLDLARSLSAMGILLFRLDRLEEAEEKVDEAASLLDEAGVSIQEPEGSPLAELVLSNRARIIGHAGRTGEALRLLAPLVNLSRRRGLDVQTALALYHQSELLLLDGVPERASEVARESMDMCEDLELPHLEWSARLYYVHAVCDLGEMARARAAVEKLVREAPTVGEVTEALVAAGRAISDDAAAIQVLGAASRLMDRSEVAERWARRRLEASLAARRPRLPGHLYELHYERGRATPGPRAIPLAEMALGLPVA